MFGKSILHPFDGKYRTATVRLVGYYGIGYYVTMGISTLGIDFSYDDI